MNTVQGLADLLTREGVEGRVAFVGADFFPMKYWFALQQLTPQIEWQIEDDLVREARWIKSPRELEAYREASHTVSKALTILMESLQLGKPEAEAAAAAAHEVTRRGGHIHMMPISHGKLIHYFARDPLNGFSQDAPVNGDLVRGWVYGPMFQGYWMDPGRTAVCGRASNSQKHLVESCAKIVATLISEIKPGRSMSDLAKLGHQLVADFGGAKDQAAEQFPLFGHGLGLFFERPEIATDMGCENDVFQEGMVMGVEAFLAMPGVGSAGYEDNIIIGKDGAELLTTTPSVWW
jgi:Xaa-Pro aminopeptidase